MTDELQHETKEKSKRKKAFLTEEEKTPKTSFKPIASEEKLHASTMTYDQLIHQKRYMYEDLMRIFIAAKIPITLWGPPGAGKTKTIQQLRNEKDEDGVNYQVITVQPSTEDSTVFNGLMTVHFDSVEEKYIMEKSIPKVAEQVWEAFRDWKRLTIMFLDEMTTCVPSQQHAMLGLLTDGTYGPLDISPYVTFVMAANPPNTVSEVIPLGNQVINRSGHIPWFSDVEQWYDGWSSGFGNPNKIKSDKVLEDIKELIESDREHMFRDDEELADDPEEMWDEDNLVPYEQMRSTERALTLFADIYQVLMDNLTSVSYEVRRLYVKECARAILGNRWADKMAVVFENRSLRVETQPIITEVTKNGIDFDSTYEEIIEKVGDNLHRLNGKKMTTDTERELAERFNKEIFEDTFSIQRYLSFWVWLASSDNEATRAPVIPIAANIMQNAFVNYRLEIAKEQLVPKFVPKTIKEEISLLRSIRKNMS